jgi:hypothetical protein
MFESCPINEEGDNLFAIPLKNLKVEIKNQEGTDDFKNHQGFISSLFSIHIAHPSLASQSF